jgi:hypothetical protein
LPRQRKLQPQPRCYACTPWAASLGVTKHKDYLYFFEQIFFPCAEKFSRFLVTKFRDKRKKGYFIHFVRNFFKNVRKIGCVLRSITATACARVVVPVFLDLHRGSGLFGLRHTILGQDSSACLYPWTRKKGTRSRFPCVLQPPRLTTTPAPTPVYIGGLPSAVCSLTQRL